MARFGIRNYGPSRQVSHKGKQICFCHDQYIETDDAELAKAIDALGEEDQSFHVTDRGEEAATSVPPDKRKKKKRSVTVDDAEAVHDEKFPDKDEDDKQRQQTQENQQPESNEDTDEIGYADMSYKELQVLAKDRQLKHHGVERADLIQVLEIYDRDG